MPRDERKIHNQALFRSVNEQIAELEAKFGEPTDAGLLSFVCECPQIGCRAFVRAPLEVYDRVHEAPALFLVLKGHEDGEAIVDDLGGYLIVTASEKTTVAQTPEARSTASGVMPT